MPHYSTRKPAAPKTVTLEVSKSTRTQSVVSETVVIYIEHMQERYAGNKDIHAEDWETDSEDQELRAENVQLKSSMDDLAKEFSQEREKSEAAAERATAAEDRATATEGRAAVVAGRATDLSTQMQSVTRAPNAETETMRGMQRDDILPSDEETFSEWDQSRNEVDHAQEENNVSRVPFQGHAEVDETPDTHTDEEADIFQNVTEEHAAVASTPIVQESLLDVEVAAHRQTREELAQLKEQSTATDLNLENARKLISDLIESCQEFEQLQIAHQEELDDANLEISDLRVSNDRLRFRIRPLQRQVVDLESRINALRSNAARMLQKLVDQDAEIRMGRKDLKFFIRLGTGLFSHLNIANKLLNGAPGRADGLLRLAEQCLRTSVVGSPFNDVVNGDNEPKVQLAIEGPPADFSAMQNAETVCEYRRMLSDVDIGRLPSEMFEVRDGTASDDDNVAVEEAEGPAFVNSDFENGGDVASSPDPDAIYEDTSKDTAVPGFLFAFRPPTQATEPEAHNMARGPGFTFSFGMPAQEIRQGIEGTAIKPIFAFGGNPAQESQQEAEGMAKRPVIQFSATPVQETRHETPSEATASPQELNPSQQTVVSDVYDVQEAQEKSEDGGEWNDIEDEDHKEEEDGGKGATELKIGNHEVTRDHHLANEPHTPKAEGNATATNRLMETFGQDFNFGATASIFGAQTNPNPVPNSNSDSASSNFAPRTDFNDGSTNAFIAGPSSFTAGSTALGVGNQDEQKEEPRKKCRNASKFGAPSSIGLGPSSSKTKKEETNKAEKTGSVFEAAAGIELSFPASGRKEETKKTMTASIFDAAASVNLSSLSSDNKAAIAASVNHDPKGTSKTPDSTATDSFKLSETAAKDEEEKQEPAPETQPSPTFGAGTSINFSFSPSGVMPMFAGSKTGAAGTSIAPLHPPAEKKKAVEGDGEEKMPAKGAAKVEQADREPVSATGFADTNQGEAESSAPTQGSFSIPVPQLPGLSAASESSSSVHSVPTMVGSSENQGDRQQAEGRMGEKKNVVIMQEVTGTPSDEASRMSSTSPSISEDRVEVGAPDVPGQLELDAPALTHIVDSVPPAVQENHAGEDLLGTPSSQSAYLASQIKANEAGGYSWHDPGRTAAEILASWEVEDRERAASTLADGVNGKAPPTASVPWREPKPEWSAELPSLAADPTKATTTYRSPALTPAAGSILGANYGTVLTVSPAITKLVAHMLETAPMTIRIEDGHSNLIEVGAIEGAMQYATGAMQSLYSGPATHPGIMPNVDTEVHLLSGDRIARHDPIRHAMHRPVDDIEKEVEIESEYLTRTEDAQEIEVFHGNERYAEQETSRQSGPQVTESPILTRTDMRDVARFLTRRRYGRVARGIGELERHLGRAFTRGSEPQVTKSPALTQPAIDNEEVLMIQVGEAQEAMAICEQDGSAELEVVVEHEPQEIDSTVLNDDRAELQRELQMAPQMIPQPHPQMAPQMPPQPHPPKEHTPPPSEIQPPAPKSIADTTPGSRQRTSDATPRDSKGKLCIWSLRKKR